MIKSIPYNSFGVQCKNCGAFLEYEEEDVVQFPLIEWNGLAAYIELIPCPECNHDVVL